MCLIQSLPFFSRCFFKILTVVEVIINARAEEDIVVIVSPGAFFDEVPEAYYTTKGKSIPLIYTDTEIARR